MPRRIHSEIGENVKRAGNIRKPGRHIINHPRIVLGMNVRFFRLKGGDPPGPPKGPIL